MSDDYDVSGIQVICMGQNLYGLIEQIKVRPGLFLDEVGISALYYVICGYTQACAINHVEESETPPFGQFHEFVRQKTGFPESTSGWKNMILAVNDKNEAKALAMFFVLFEEFTASALLRVSK
jgi:hypothetical protein